MADEKQYSEQTKAIIDRLKAEGDLSRNSGTNSLKEVIKRLQGVEEETKKTNVDLYYGLQQVRLEIGRFSDVFQSISANTIRQTEILRSSVDISQTIDGMFEEQKKLLNASIESDKEERQLREKAAALETEDRERQRREKDFQSVEPPPPPEPPAPPKDGDGDKGKKGKEKSGKGVFGILKDNLPSFKNLLIGAAGLFVGFNVLKGYIDEVYNGAFTSFQQKIMDALEKFYEVITHPGLMNFLESLAKYSVPVAATYFAISKLGPAIENLLGTIFQFLLIRRLLRGPQSAFVGPPAPAGPGMLAGLKNWFSNLPAGGRLAPITSQLSKLFTGRGLIATSIAGFAIGYGNDVAKYIEKQASDKSIEELANTPVTQFGGTVASNTNIIFGAATIGSIFGVKGLIAGAVVGLVLALGMAAYNKINDFKNDVDEVSNATQIALTKMRDDIIEGRDPTEAYQEFRKSTDEDKLDIEAKIAENVQEIRRLENERDSKLRARPMIARDRERHIKNYASKIEAVREDNRLRDKQLRNLRMIRERSANEYVPNLPAPAENVELSLQQQFERALEPLINGSAAPTIINNTPTTVNNNNVSNVSNGGSTNNLVAMTGVGGGGSLYPGYVS